MKTQVIGFVLAASTIAFVGCKRVNGKGEVETRHYDLSNFDEVDLSGVGDVQIITDANSFVEVETHANLFEALEIRVDEDDLKIGTKKGYNIGKYDKLTIYVHAPRIEHVEVSGSGTITGSGAFAVVESFDADVSGSGEINIAGIVAQSVDADVSGSGNIRLAGTASNAELEVSGSGNIRAFDLTSTNTEAQVSGSGNVETTTTGSLNVRISGSGNVSYKGQPSINVSGSGSGNVTNAN